MNMPQDDPLYGDVGMEFDPTSTSWYEDIQAQGDRYGSNNPAFQIFYQHFMPEKYRGKTDEYGRSIAREWMREYGGYLTKQMDPAQTFFTEQKGKTEKQNITAAALASIDKLGGMSGKQGFAGSSDRIKAYDEQRKKYMNTQDLHSLGVNKSLWQAKDNYMSQLYGEFNTLAGLDAFTNPGIGDWTTDAQPIADDDDDSSCFHPDTTVEYEDGSIKTVREVKYGDKVKAIDKNGNIIYSEVWEDKYFNLKDTTTPKYYITIKAGNKTLKVTAMHTVFVDNIKKNVNAKNVKPGMHVNIVDYEKDIIERRMVDSVTHEMDYGKYDLYTKEGTVIADGIVTGTLAFLKHKPAQFLHKFVNKYPKLYKFMYKYMYSPLFHYFYPVEEKSLAKNISEVRI